MKRILVFVAACIMLTPGLNAQSFGIGARMGPGVSTLLTDDEEIQEILTFVGGVQGDVYSYKMFNKYVGIEGGLMLTQAGYRIEADPDDFNMEGDFETKITYFAIPLSARFKFGYFTLNPGIRPSFLIKARQEGEDVTDQVTSTDIGFFVSPGVQFPIGLTLSSTIYMGFTDVYKDLSTSGILNTNFSLQFSVGYTFFRKGD